MIWILLLFPAAYWAARTRTVSTSSAAYEYSTDAVSASSYKFTHHQYFPNSEIVLDLAILSGSVYKLMHEGVSCHDHSSTKKLVLPKGSECLQYFHDLELGTQVLVVRSTLHNYVAVSFAGTDDLTTFSTDGNAVLSDFGPSQTMMDDENVTSIFKNVPGGIGVHRGFNNAVFNSDLFPALMKCVALARLGGACCHDEDGGTSSCVEGKDNYIPIFNSSAPYQLFTTGHSLGAANAVLLGAALHLAYPDENIRSINFGCPKIGAAPWMEWVNSLQPDRKGVGSRASSFGSYEIFRFVNKLDVIPRQPRFLLSHVGHTLQMTVGGSVQAFYEHIGDRAKGYAGVPFWWEEAAFALMPLALASHAQNHYVSYLKHYKPKAGYYVDKFQRTEDFEGEFEPSQRNDAQIGESVGILRTLLLLPILLSPW